MSDTNGYKSVLDATEDERIAEASEKPTIISKMIGYSACLASGGFGLDDCGWLADALADIARNLKIVDASSQPTVDSSVSKESLQTDTVPVPAGVWKMVVEALEYLEKWIGPKTNFDPVQTLAYGKVVEALAAVRDIEGGA